VPPSLSHPIRATLHGDLTAAASPGTAAPRASAAPCTRRRAR